MGHARGAKVSLHREAPHPSIKSLSILEGQLQRVGAVYGVLVV